MVPRRGHARAYKRRAVVVAALFLVVLLVAVEGLVLVGITVSELFPETPVALLTLVAAALIGTPAVGFGGVLVYRRERESAKARAETCDLQAAISEQLWQADRHEQSVLAGMNHALQTPLTAILGLSDALRTQMLGPLSQEEHARYCADIYDAAEDLRGVIADSFGAVDAKGAARALDLGATFGLPGWPGPVRLPSAPAFEGGPNRQERLMTDKEDQVDRLSVLAKEFTPAAMEYHRREMGKEGYSLEGPIVRHRYSVIDGPGVPTDLFDGEEFYTATFVRRK